MQHKSCDELAANLAEAALQYDIRPDLALAESLIETVSARYGSSDFEILLEAVLDGEELEGVDREAYKFFLGRFFGARAQMKLQARREAFSLPFAPR